MRGNRALRRGGAPAAPGRSASLHSKSRARRRPRWRTMSDLVSKVLAGGLSAGVFVVWWPAHVPAQGGEWLLARGLLWTLAFELLLLAFRPLERTVGDAVRRREARAMAPRRIAPLLALAAVAAAAPVAMLSGARAPIASPARAAAP